MSELSLITYDHQSKFIWPYLQFDSRLIIHFQRHEVALESPEPPHALIRLSYCFFNNCKSLSLFSSEIGYDF
jgi:hypothetical protein